MDESNKINPTKVAVIMVVVIVTVLCAIYGSWKVSSLPESVVYRYTPVQPVDQPIRGGVEPGTKVKRNDLTHIAVSKEDQLKINTNIKSLSDNYSQVTNARFAYALIEVPTDKINSLLIYVSGAGSEKVSSMLVTELIHLFAKNNISAEYDAIEVALLDDNNYVYDSFGMNNVQDMIKKINNK